MEGNARSSAFQERSEDLLRLADYLSDEEFRRAFTSAYIADTSFTCRDVLSREIETPARLLKLARPDEELLSHRQPLGRVAVMVPKNSLGLTLAKAIAGAYLMGNGTLVYLPGQLKNTAPLYGKMLETFMPGIEIAYATHSSAQFLRGCLKDPEVKAVVVYGDDAWIDAYHGLAEQTGTKLIFEGPGNDPLVVMEDAGLEAAVDGAIRGGLNNGGQSCSAFERFFVQAALAVDFKELLIEKLHRLKLGNPLEGSTDVGPIASRVIMSRMVSQLEEAVAQGAKLEYGGEVISEATTGLPMMVPAVLSGCRHDMAVVAKETFGPVFPILAFSGMSDLLPALEATNYGLNASLYGSAEPGLLDYLRGNHRNFYENSTCVCPQNIASRMLDGGFKRSGFVWEQQSSYITRTGQRYLAYELSRA